MAKLEKVGDQASILEELTKQYPAAAKKSCGAHIEMGELIVRADQELNEANRTRFLKDIGNPKGGTLREMRLIGENSPRSSPTSIACRGIGLRFISWPS